MSKKTRVGKRTMTHSAINHAPATAAWRRKGTEWLLLAAGQILARITRDGTRWLCWRTEDIGDDGFIGPMPSLAAAKAYLGRRAFAAMSHAAKLEQAPL